MRIGLALAWRWLGVGLALVRRGLSWLGFAWLGEAWLGEFWFDFAQPPPQRDK